MGLPPFRYESFSFRRETAAFTRVFHIFWQRKQLLPAPPDRSIGICWAEALSWERVARAARRVWGGTTYLVPPLIRPSVRTGAPSPRGRHLPANSQFAEASLVEGPRGSCTSCPTSVTHLLRALPAKSQLAGCLRRLSLASPYGRGAPEGGGEGPLSHG